MLLILSTGSLAFAEECPTARVQGVYIASSCTKEGVTLFGMGREKGYECHPIVEITSTDKLQSCEGAVWGFLGFRDFSNMTCTNEVPLLDPNGLLDNIDHGTPVDIEIDCLTVKSLY